MTGLRPLAFVAALGIVSALALGGCATPSLSSAPPAAGPDVAAPAPPDGELLAQGTVIDDRGDVKLCLGGVQESLPPQCAGIPVTGWTWAGVDGSESASEVTWGTYAVHGTYDGASFTVTRPPVMLALFDPMPLDDPTNGELGAGTEAELARIQEQLPTLIGTDFLMSYPENGWVWADVVWDDGTLQDAVDVKFGPGLVVIRSALQPVGS